MEAWARQDRSALVCLKAGLQGRQGSTLLALFIVICHVSQMKVNPPAHLQKTFNLHLCKTLRDARFTHAERLWSFRYR